MQFKIKLQVQPKRLNNWINRNYALYVCIGTEEALFNKTCTERQIRK